ncbi:MAG: M20 family dipeptidase [Hyphomicrobiales bacterium]|nr:M20 family dipeptidase [Hyphomicrobiales bacterium]
MPGRSTRLIIAAPSFGKDRYTPEDILARFRDHAAAHGLPDLAIEGGMQHQPTRTAVDHPFGKMVGRALAVGFDQEPIVTPVVGRLNPNYVWMEMLGLPMAEVSYGQYDCRMHAPDERYSLACLRSGILASAMVMIGAARGAGLSVGSRK